MNNMRHVHLPSHRTRLLPGIFSATDRPYPETTDEPRGRSERNQQLSSDVTPCLNIYVLLCAARQLGTSLIRQFKRAHTHLVVKLKHDLDRLHCGRTMTTDMASFPLIVVFSNELKTRRVLRRLGPAELKSVRT